MTNSIWIWWDQWKSIVSMLAIRLKEHVSSVGQVEIVCRFRQDRVSILSERSSRDRLSISPGFWWILAHIWKIFTGVRNCRERGDRGDKIQQKSFLNSLKGIAQRSKVKMSKNTACSRPGQSSIDRPVDRCARRAQTWPGRLTRSTDWKAVALGWSRSTRPVDRGQGPVDPQTRSVLLSGFRLLLYFGVESNRSFLNL